MAISGRGMASSCKRAVPFLTPALPLSGVTGFGRLRSHHVKGQAETGSFLASVNSAGPFLAHWRHHYLYSLNCPVFIVVELAVSRTPTLTPSSSAVHPYRLVAFFPCKKQTNKMLLLGLCSYLFSSPRHCCCHLCPSFLSFLSLLWGILLPLSVPLLLLSELILYIRLLGLYSVESNILLSSIRFPLRSLSLG